MLNNMDLLERVLSTAFTVESESLKAKRKKAKNALGTRWLLHASNRVGKAKCGN